MNIPNKKKFKNYGRLNKKQLKLEKMKKKRVRRKI
jgi:hypothetical protein